MKKRCTIPPSSSSSSSSSSCIESPITAQKSIIPPKIKPNKRVRAKKIVNAADNSATSPKSRSSIYRGVTRHRWTGRYEAHLWDKSTWNNLQNKRGRQIYLGAYDNEDDAARTYDLAALKYWGPTTVLNFPLDTYTKDLEEMENLTKEEYLAILRRKSSGFSRGVSKYRGVARHHHNGRWEARIGRVTGNKYLYLGTYNTQEEAAEAYDMAAIEFRGANAVTNFDISHYADKLKQILPDMQVQEEEPQVKEEIILDSSNLAQPDEPHDHDRHQQHDENQVQSSVMKLESIDSIDSQSMVMMDPVEAHEHPWDLCLDIGFNMLPIPDIPLESDYYNLFDEKDFADDIESLFSKYGSEVAQDAISGTDGYKMEADILPGRELKETKVTDVSHSPSSSSLSTMASVCSSGYFS